MFDAMVDRIKETTCKFLLSARIQGEPAQPAPEPVKVVFTGKELTKEEREAQKKSKNLIVQKTVAIGKSKAGRNDPCPCGSGKKYKNCCWATDHMEQVVNKKFKNFIQSFCKSELLCYSIYEEQT